MPSSRTTPKCKSIASWIEDNLDSGSVVREESQGSSSWSSASIYETDSGAKYFVKTSRSQDLAMFKGEALGLNAMHDTNTLAVPQVFHYGQLSGKGQQGTFIAMECLDIRGRCDMAELGRQLGLMHLSTPQDENAKMGKFGFPVDNTIGGTLQPNKYMDDCIWDMTGDSRLNRLGDKLLPNMEHFFKGAGEIKPCILHGDLWSGNIAASGGQEAVHLDPACYYGHHEAEFGHVLVCASEVGVTGVKAVSKPNGMQIVM
eukprot:gene25588-11241_t